MTSDIAWFAVKKDWMPDSWNWQTDNLVTLLCFYRMRALGGENVFAVS